MGRLGRRYQQAEALLGLDGLSADAKKALRDAYEGRPIELNLVGAVLWSGAESLRAHLPSAFLDKTLGDMWMAGDRAGAFSLLEEIYGFLLEAEVASGLLRDRGGGDVPLARRVSMNAGVDVVGELRVTAVIHLSHARRMLGTESWYDPVELTIPVMMKAAFWAFWDWTCLELAADPKEIVSLFRRLNGQVGLAREILETTEALELGRIPYWLAFEQGTGTLL